MVRKTQRLPIRSLKNGTVRESKKVQASSVDMRRRWLAKKAQFVLTRHSSHFGLVGLQISWPWCFSSR